LSSLIDQHGWFFGLVSFLCPSIIHYPASIHLSIPHGVPVAGCFTAAALVLLQLRSDHAKAQILGEFHEEFCSLWVGGRRKQKKISRAE
jgi:hypothetical protein